MIKRVVITGATSMLGIGLINYLLQNNVEKIIAVCSRESNRKAQIPKDERITVVGCNLSEIEHLRDMIEGEYEIFYHFAWEGTKASERNNPEVQLNNIRSTLKAVKAAKDLGCHLFIGTGSQAEYGNQSIRLNENLLVGPESAYGITKYTAGKLSSLYAKEIGIGHIWVRVVSVYGPQDRSDTMIMSSLKELLKNKKAAFTKGEQLWDYLYQDDAARALALIGAKGKSDSIYVLGSGKARMLKSYIEDMLAVLGEEYTANMGEIPYAEQTRMYLCGDITSLTKDTGFIPEIDFKTGISHTIKYLRQEYAKGKEK